MQNSATVLHAGKAQSLKTSPTVAAGTVFHYASPLPFAIHYLPRSKLSFNLPSTFSTRAKPLLSRLNLSSPSPHPFRQPIHLAYFSVTARQCGWFFALVPSFVCLLTAKFCSCVFPYRWRGRLLLFLPLLPLLLHAEHTQHYSRCALTHTALSSIFPSRSLQMFLCFYFYFCFLSSGHVQQHIVFVSGAKNDKSWRDRWRQSQRQTDRPRRKEKRSSLS